MPTCPLSILSVCNTTVWQLARRIYFATFLAVVLAGCAAQSPDKPPHELTVSYGEAIGEILKRLPPDGKLLFRFTSNGHHYDILASNGYQRETENRFLFLVEDGLLVSVVTADTAIKTWGRIFGNFAVSLPVPDKFPSIVADLAASREIPASIDFQLRPSGTSTKPSRSSDYFRASGEMAVLGGIYSMLIPWYAPVAYGMAGVTAGVGAANAIADAASRDSPRKYRSFLKKLDKISLGSNQNVVSSIMGLPADQIPVESANGALVIQYLGPHIPVALGFVSGELQWIGYDYNAIEVLRRRKQFEKVMGPYHPLARSLWLKEFQVQSRTYPEFRARNTFRPPLLDQEGDVAPKVATDDRWEVTNVIDGAYLIQSRTFESRHCDKLSELRSRAKDVLPVSCDSARHGFLIDPSGNIAGGWVRISLIGEARAGYILFNPIRHQRETWPPDPVFVAELRSKSDGK